MSILEAQIKIVNEKLQQLLKKNAALQRQNEMLHAEVTSFKKKEEDYKASIESISQKVHILQAASGTMSKEDQRKLESHIEKYIKDIDRCITMLSE